MMLFTRGDSDEMDQLMSVDTFYILEVVPTQVSIVFTMDGKTVPGTWVGPNVPVKYVKELIAYCKRESGR